MDNTTIETVEAQPSADDAAYAELAKEIEGTEPQTEDPTPEGDKPAAKKDDEPKPDYEKLSKEYNDLRGALGEERNQRKALREEKEQLANQVANMQEFLRSMREDQMRAQQQMDEQYLTPEEIQQRRLEEQVRSVADQNKQLSEWKQQQEQQARAQFVEQQTFQTFIQSERQFAERTPDYYDAAKALADSRLAELAVFYPDGNPQVEQLARQNGMSSAAELRQYMLKQDTLSIAAQARQVGADPAQYIYALAKGRGFSGPSQQPAAPTAQTKLDVVKAGQKAAGSLSTGASTSKDASGFPSQAELADMYITDPEKADAVWNKMRQAGAL
jgi:hypothetical protein